MSEETTTIEELLDSIMSVIDLQVSDYNSTSVEFGIEKVLNAHRDKYKHTKEDVIEAFEVGYNEGGYQPYDSAEQYYNETHNK